MSEQILENNSEAFMSETKHELGSSLDRIIFVSMFNDITNAECSKVQAGVQDQKRLGHTTTDDHPGGE